MVSSRQVVDPRLPSLQISPGHRITELRQEQVDGSIGAPDGTMRLK